MRRVPMVVFVTGLMMVFACSMASAQYRFGNQEKPKDRKARVGYYNSKDGSGGIAFGADFPAGKDVQVGVTYAETDVAGTKVSIFPVVDVTYMTPQETDYWSFENPKQRTYYGGGITWARVGGGINSSDFGYHLLAGSDLQNGKYFAELRYSVVDVKGFGAGGFQLYGGMRF